MHDADHILLMVQSISSRFHIMGTDDDLTDNRSLRVSSFRTSGSTGNIRAGTIGFDHEDPISINTSLEDRRSSLTTDGASTDLHSSSGRVLNLEGTREVTQDGRNKVILNITSNRATGGTEESVVTISSEARVTG